MGLGIILPIEYRRLQEAIDSPVGWAGWLTIIDPDTTLYLFAFLLLPFAWFLQKRSKHREGRLSTVLAAWFSTQTKPHAQTARQDVFRSLVLAILVAAVSWGMSYHLGQTPVKVVAPYTQYLSPLSELPPAFHDEYSYLFQAKTFLAGRIANPSHPAQPELFDQIHVLNDQGVYAGRYFPGTAIWMAPFVAAGKPHWGHWLAGALSAAFVFYIGRELAGHAVGFLAGLLTALSPGILTFGQMLLAHHPALMSLTFFAWMFLRMMRTRSLASSALAGAGLIFAALCRPMTAAGIGLPFGVWLLFWWLRGDKASRRSLGNFKRRTLLVLSMAVPIALGIGGMMAYNSRLTGDLLTTPYQLYTDIYTPRHVYGFNNVERAKANPSTKVVEKYDRWAENLTPALAARNVKDRLIASGQWVLGLVPLAMAICAFPFVAGRGKFGPMLSDRRWWLVLFAATSLHVAHIPYWYAGIRNWHYVFEAAPFLLLVFAGVTSYLLSQWWSLGHVGLSLWWMSLIWIALGIAYGPLAIGLESSLVRSAIQEDIWARRNYAVFHAMLDHVVSDRPALVLIAEDPSDRHIDYVTNDPLLDGPILRGRFRPDINPLERVLESFPDRAVYVVVLNAKTLKEIESGRFSNVRFIDLGQQPIVSRTAFVYRLSLPGSETP